MIAIRTGLVNFSRVAPVLLGERFNVNLIDDSVGTVTVVVRHLKSASTTSFLIRRSRLPGLPNI